jgi:hypothetical protein
MTYQVVVRCSTGGWVFHFATKEEAVTYARAIRAGGDSTKLRVMKREGSR